MKMRAPDRLATATVYVVEDDLAIRKSVRALLQSVDIPAETFATGEQFYQSYDHERPCCLVLDLRLPDTSGLKLMQRLRERWNYCPPTIIITGHGDVPTAVQLMKMGVVDFLEKPFSPQQLLDQVQAALARDRQTRQRLAVRERMIDAIASLSQREREVLHELMTGKPNKLIAVKLNLSAKTVSTHRANILAKLNAQSLIEIARVLDTDDELYLHEPASLRETIALSN